MITYKECVTVAAEAFDEEDAAKRAIANTSNNANDLAMFYRK